MWGRVVEIMTAVWLAISPWIFGVSDQPQLVWSDMLIALAIATCSGLSYWRPTRRAHLVILLISVGLIAWGRLSGTPPIAAHQNHIVIGLFLLMIALIPNEASRPPEPWRFETTAKV
ncbi:SPW repeat protein [Crateriforma conspicua]|uniref:SPW repeat protein n=1 Tax=Crateriforma conspicua TaxID=2527996 RepID=A0A5C6FY96_9PLAN|nr:SPW repeat protein [Crateriforma conspicua]TWU66595.1 SPW repeat protein [Crateriforma conspicua]